MKKIVQKFGGTSVRDENESDTCEETYSNQH